jgi:hypothetical protein
MKNPHLEMLSEMVRRGEPVTMREAIDVIEYQTQLKKQRKDRSWWEAILFATPIGMGIKFIKDKIK